MPLAKEDLEFVLTIDADASRAESVLANFGKGLGFSGQAGAGGNLATTMGLLQQGSSGGMLGTLGGALGGALGAAFGAPEVGQILGKELAELLPRVLATPAQLAATALRGVADGLRGLQGTLGPIGVGFDVAGKALQGLADGVKKIPVVGELLGPMMDAIAQIPGIIKDIFETLTVFGAKANPAAFQRMQMAVDDFMAVIGHSFLPVMEMMTEVIRGLGDALAEIMPSAAEVRDALTPLRDAFRELLQTLREFAAQPIFKNMIVGLLRALAEVLALLVRTVTGALSALQNLLRTFGLWNDQAQPGKSSFGAAARGASFAGFDDYSRKIQLAAYTAGTGGPADLNGNVYNIAQDVNTISRWTNIMTPQGLALAIAAIFTGGMNGDPHGASQAVQTGPLMANGPAGVAASLGLLMGSKLREIFGGV